MHQTQTNQTGTPLGAFPLLLVVLAQLLIPASAIAQSIRPATDRLDAIVSYPLVIALTVENERDLRSGVTTKLDDGRILNSPAFWVGISPHTPIQSWTNHSGIWTASSYDAIAEFPINQRPTGAWFIRIPLPIDAVGQGLWISGERYELNWLPAPERTTLEASGQDEQTNLKAFWSLHLDQNQLSDPAVKSAIDQLNHDPFQRWRARLLTDGLNPEHSTDPSAQSLAALELELELDTPSAELMRSIAIQQESRWQIILGRIWLLDPDAAIRLKNQLIRTARFGDRILPIWTADTIELARLAHDLLSPFVDDHTRVLRANAWLEIQPRALAWISDDQGQIEINPSDTDSDGNIPNRFLSTLTTLSLPQSPGSSLFRVDIPDAHRYQDPVLQTLPPYQATDILVPIDTSQISPTNPIPQSEHIRVSTGRWNAKNEVISSITRARAPYIQIGPFHNDWTMRALMNNRPLEGAIPPPSRSSMGILRRNAHPNRNAPETGWQLYMELASHDPTSTNESLTLWIGPYTNPYASWTISPNQSAGQQITFDHGSRVNLGLPKVQIRILDDRWIALIDLPPGVFDEDLQLQLGFERVDSLNAHTAWPRRMIPGQPEPGRITIKADNFDQLGQ